MDIIKFFAKIHSEAKEKECNLEGRCKSNEEVVAQKVFFPKDVLSSAASSAQRFYH